MSHVRKFFNHEEKNQFTARWARVGLFARKVKQARQDEITKSRTHKLEACESQEKNQFTARSTRLHEFEHKVRKARQDKIQKSRDSDPAFEPGLFLEKDGRNTSLPTLRAIPIPPPIEITSIPHLMVDEEDGRGYKRLSSTESDGKKGKTEALSPSTAAPSVAPFFQKPQSIFKELEEQASLKEGLGTVKVVNKEPLL